MKRALTFFIFVISLLLLLVTSSFSFDGNSSGYQTQNQFISAATNGASASYTTTGSGSTMAGNGSSASYVVEFGQLPSCGNNRCDAGETTSSCAIDCPAAVVSSGGSSSSSGPSFAPAPSTPTDVVTETHTVSIITADEPVSVVFEQTPISQIVMTLFESVYSAKISVEEHNTLPAQIFAAPVSKTSLVIEFKHDRINNNLFSAVSFIVAVPKTIDIALSELGVFRFVNDEWQSVPFTLLHSDDKTYSLNVTTPGLSYFVVGKKLATENTSSEQSVQVVDESQSTSAQSESIQPLDDTLSNAQVSPNFILYALILAACISGGFVIRAVLIKKVEKVQQAPISPNATLVKFNKLDEWIVQGLATGHTPEQLRKRLLDSGWKREQFEEDFTRVITEISRK